MAYDGVHRSTKAVAHSDPARKINGVHMNGGVEISNGLLPSIVRFKEMMAMSGLAVESERDDDSYFICIARKG